MENLISRIGLEAVEQAAETTENGGGMLGNMNSFMAFFMIIIGVFIMYSAITGKGPAYKNDYPKAIQEEHHKMMRKFCWIVGPVALAAGILDYMHANGSIGFPYGYWIGLGIIIPAIVVYIIIFRRKFKKYLK